MMCRWNTTKMMISGNNVIMAPARTIFHSAPIVGGREIGDPGGE